MSHRPLVALVLLLTLALPARAAEIVGHRGASADAPENTMSSFKLGYAQDADADELDIHLTKDGKVVVIHDYDTKRVGGVDWKVVDQTFDEIRKVNVAAFGKWKEKSLTERVPTLAEVLAIVPKGKRLFIEIKVHQEILPALEQVLREAPTTPQQTAIITFYYDVAAAAKKRFPDRAVYWLVGKDKETKEFPKVDDLIRKAREASLDGLDVEYHFPLDYETVKRVKAAGLRLYVWTLDDARKARELITAGIDGVTTNRPGALRMELDDNPKP